MTSFNVVLFDEYETMDAFGPVEVIGKLHMYYELGYYSMSGGPIKSSQQFYVDTKPFLELNPEGILLIPGGMGTRTLVSDDSFISKIKKLALSASYVLTVCTGSALLSKTGLLDCRNATTNKYAFDWVCSVGTKVNWQKKARWVCDGKFYTSSGVSAGIDMALGFVSDMHNPQAADKIAKYIEYIRNPDKDNDPFCIDA